MNPQIELVHEPSEEEPFLILNKPKFLPSAPLKEGDVCAYTQAQHLYPDLDKVIGKKPVEHGLVHRIDTETDGLLLIAATQDFYEWIQMAQNAGDFVKQYTAFCHCDSAKVDESFPPSPFWGIPVFRPVKIRSMFRFYGPKNSLVRPVTEECSRIVRSKASKTVYTTEIDSIEKFDGGVKVKCSIERGFKHQVRCHLAWCGLSVYGDKKYSKDGESEGDLRFSATGLKFPLKNGKEFIVEI